MKRVFVPALLALMSAVFSPHAGAQVAGTTTLAVAVTGVREVAVGWSVKRQILGRDVYHEDGDRVGKIDDLIVALDTAVSYAIVGTGGFVGAKRHQGAIPVSIS